MTRITQFLKTTIAGGFFVLLPVALLFLLLGEVFDVAIAVATPLADIFPEGTFEARFPALLAILLIILASFILGLFMLSDLARRFGEAIENKVLAPIPGYLVLKKLTHSLGNQGRTSGFRPAFKQLADGTRQIVFLTEDHGNGWATIIIPRSPTAMSGPVEVVSMEKITLVDAEFVQYLDCLSYWGDGISNFVTGPAEKGRPTLTE